MKKIRVAAAILNQTPRDWQGNFRNIVSAIFEAKMAGVSVLCLPELAITGYGLEDDLFCPDIVTRALQKLHDLKEHCKSIVVCVGLPLTFNNSLYNAVATIVDGNILGFTCKQHLAGDGIHYEPRHFKPWPKGVVQHINIDGVTYPIGDVHFNIGSVKIGYEICEDAWVANRPGSVLASKGIDIILNPSASHFSFGKLETRKNFVVDGSRAFNCTYIYANLVGNESGRVIFDGGALIASGGKLLAQGRRFTYLNYLLTTAVVDIDVTRTQQVRTASFEPNIANSDEGCISVPFKYLSVPQTYQNSYFKDTGVTIDSWEKSDHIKHEECTRAIGLALLDYMRKSHTKGFVISLSGGADSSMVTYLCVTAIKLAIQEIGIRFFIQKYCPWLGGLSLADEKNIIYRLVTTAYQATAQSGQVTRNAANEVAKALGVDHNYLDVEPMVQEYLKVAKYAKGDELNFDDDAGVLKNLQARVRAPSIWIFANMFGKLLLTTSNMSEAALGYATMDGDTAGCVSPIAGISKHYIKEYLTWVQAFGPYGIGRLYEMILVIQQAPTAELMPAKYGETDEKDLMPYWILHEIQSMVVKLRYVPLEIYKELLKYKDIPNNDLIDWIVKFFRLFSINQWKRERYALSFHLDDHNLDPRTWCRTPILTGGYEEELAELEKFRTK